MLLVSSVTFAQFVSCIICLLISFLYSLPYSFSTVNGVKMTDVLLLTADSNGPALGYVLANDMYFSRGAFANSWNYDYMGAGEFRVCKECITSLPYGSFSYLVIHVFFQGYRSKEIHNFSVNNLICFQQFLNMLGKRVFINGWNTCHLSLVLLPINKR